MSLGSLGIPLNFQIPTRFTECQGHPAAWLEKWDSFHLLVWFLGLATMV